MQKQIVTLWILALSIGSCRLAHAEQKNVWVLLVGVSKYQNPQIATLRFPAADATSIHDALVDPELGGVPEANVRLLTDDQATAVNILSTVDTFLKSKVKRGDRVILFLAGHGVTKGIGLDAKGYFLPGDVKGLTSASLESSAVNLRTLSDKLGQLPASQFVVFVDACREDPTPGRGIKGNPLSDVLSRGIQIVPQDTTHPTSSASFFACSIGQRAFEDPAFSHGVFTYWILDGIRTAAAARKPDGAVDMGVLSSYVKGKVKDWAKQASASGDFEVEQTPDFVSSEIDDPIVLMHIKKPLPDDPYAASAPLISILSNPPGAQVSLDGERLGAAPLTHSVAKSGHHALKIEAPGYAPIERQITVLDGYELQLTVSPAPGARSVGAPNSQSADLYARIQDAEARQQWEVAEAGYDAILKQDDQSVPAYEHLASLRTRQGKLRPALEVLTRMVMKTPPTAHAYSLLSTAYTNLSLQEAPFRGASAKKPKKRGGLFGGLLGNKGDNGGDKGQDDFKGGPDTYGVAKDWKDAAILARRSAEDAVKVNGSSAEANRALGFALIATDRASKNRDDCLAAFGKAVLFDPKDANNPFAMGFGIRFFAAELKDEDARKTEIERAVMSLKEAISLRPNFYEAHRELAFCYHLIGQTADAEREYETANANRGAASNKDEVAALDLSLASLYREQAKTADGDKKTNLLAASDGYYGDAKDITPDLTAAIRILTHAQLSTRIVDYMPPEIQKLLDLPDELRSKLRLPGLGDLIK